MNYKMNQVSRICFAISLCVIGSGCPFREEEFIPPLSSSSSSSGMNENIDSGLVQVCFPNSTEDCYSGSPKTQGVGACKPGHHSCSADGSVYGPCQDEVTPKNEDCSTPEDDNCDGEINENCALYKSCLEIFNTNPFAYSGKSGEYKIDTDLEGPTSPTMVHCDMITDGGGYTMVKIEDQALKNDQHSYVDICKKLGMEIVVTRTRPHAQALRDWNGGFRANILNIVPNDKGAKGINNWYGICGGKPCDKFWMTDNMDGNVSCSPGGKEPSGDNEKDSRIYLHNKYCPFLQGSWNDNNYVVEVQGWVICSTNDK